MPPRIALARCAFALLAAVLLSATMLSPRSASAAGGIITTVAGGGVGDGGPATSASLNQLKGVAVDGSGSLFIADFGNCRVRKVSGGTITTFAGIGGCGYGGDGGPATSATLSGPFAVAVDGIGDLYISDGCRVREVSGGTITTVAGNGSCGYGGDGGPAASAIIAGTGGVAVDGSGNLYIADASNCRVRKVSGGTITTVAGNGTCFFSGDGGPATSASLNWADGVAVDGSGNLYIADGNNCRVRMVSGGTITTVAGNGTCVYSGDGGPATSASFGYPGGVAVDIGGNLYIADSNNCRVRKVSGGTITTFAGNGTCAFSGDGGPATSASLNGPGGVAVDSGGNLYLVDSCRVRKVSGGTITTVAGNGSCGYYGDGGPATSASLYGPFGAAVDSGGNLYIADSGNCRIRQVSAGTITTVAGNGTCWYSGDGGPAASAGLYASDVAVDGGGNLYIADSNNCRVRKVSGGTITTVAGNGTCAYSGDGGPATSAGISNYSEGVAVDGGGNLYIADYASCRVRKVSGGTITTVAGNGTCGYGGDGSPATSALLNSPRGVAVDTGGNLYIADYANCRVRKVSGGTITTVAGSGTCVYGGDGGPATIAGVEFPRGVSVDSGGSLYIVDQGGCRVRKVTGGTITTVAGNGTCGSGGDGGPATSASLSHGKGLAVDGGGALYIADTGNNRVRKVTFAAPPSVGGVAEQPDVAALAPRTSIGADGHRAALAFAGASALAGIAVVGGWAVRRRRRAER